MLEVNRIRSIMLSVLFALLLVVPFGSRAAPLNPMQPKPEPGEVPVLIDLCDGGQLHAQIPRDTKLSLKTAYGTLKVPFADIGEIKLRTQPSARIEEAIKTHVLALSDEKPEVRDEAMQKLLRLKAQAYPTLLELEKRDQTRDAAQIVLRRLREVVPTDRLVVRKKDLITTTAAANDSLLAGMIEEQSLQVRTEQFGELTVHLSRVRQLTVERPYVVTPLGGKSNMTHCQDQVGQFYYVEVTGSVTGSVYGTDLYSADSDLATAAVHAGLVKAGAVRVVRVEIVAPPPNLFGSRRHGVLSKDYGMSTGCYRLSIK